MDKIFDLPSLYDLYPVGNGGGMAPGSGGCGEFSLRKNQFTFTTPDTTVTVDTDGELTE